MKQIIIILFAVGLLTCNQERASEVLSYQNLDRDELMSILYYECDSIIRSNDTIKIVNSKLDTTIIETGIFTFLESDYPLLIPEKLINLTKTAIQFEKLGQKEKADEFYRDFLDFYINERPKQLENYTCTNGYLQYEVNSAILCSYAFEKLGDKDSAIKSLQPFLANNEAWSSKIHKRYIQLCIEKFGIDKVRTELRNCGKTIKLKKENYSSHNDDWIVNVFGAEVGVGRYSENKTVSVSEADSIVRKLYFYKLIQ